MSCRLRQLLIHWTPQLQRTAHQNKLRYINRILISVGKTERLHRRGWLNRYTKRPSTVEAPKSVREFKASWLIAFEMTLASEIDRRSKVSPEDGLDFPCVGKALSEVKRRRIIPCFVCRIKIPYGNIPWALWIPSILFKCIFLMYILFS